MTPRQRAEKRLLKKYRDLYGQTRTDLLLLYSDIREQGDSIQVSDLYRFQSYYDLLNNLQTHCIELAEEEKIVMDEELSNQYLINAERIGTQLQMRIPVDPNLMRNCIERVWCSDGKHWSDRIWANKRELMQRVEDGLAAVLIRGDKKDGLIKQLQEDLGVSYHQARRLVVTEMSYVTTQSAIDRYSQAGIKWLEILANQAHDESCTPKNKTRILVAEAHPGLNCPPFHPNCKCTVIPVVRS